MMIMPQNESARQSLQPDRDAVEQAAAAQRAGEQGLLFADNVEPVPHDTGYRGPTACSAAGITYRQLDYWARTGLVQPTVRNATGSGTQRLYSFRDILLLKIIKSLLEAGISLKQIRKAVDHLRERGTDELTEVTLMSDGATVYECRSSDEVIDLLQGGRASSGSPSAAYGVKSKVRCISYPANVRSTMMCPKMSSRRVAGRVRSVNGAARSSSCDRYSIISLRLG